MGAFEKLIGKNRTIMIRAEGSSMRPHFVSGDIVSIKKWSFNRLQVNDIILFRKGKKNMVHRVIYKTQLYAVTKGDANRNADGKIRSSQILGKLIAIKRNGTIFDPQRSFLFQSTVYFQEIDKVVSEFSRMGVDYVILKGLPLHLYYEKKHPDRIYSDCDILIHHHSLKKGEAVLLAYGYKKVDRSLLSGKNLSTVYPETSYVKTIGGLPVVFDIHREAVFLMTQFDVSDRLYSKRLLTDLTNQLLRNKQHITIEGKVFPILKPAHLIVYLLLHFFHHNHRGIFRLDFISKVIKRYGKKKHCLKESLELVQTYKLEGFVYWGLILLKRYFSSTRWFVTELLHKVRIDYKKVQFLSQSSKSVFDDDDRVSSGIHRFKSVFFLSPEPFLRKIFVFAKPNVVKYIFWTIQTKAKRLLRNNFFVQKISN